jgi:Flp pilus assembly protein TadD
VNSLRAVKVFTRSLHLYPTDVWGLNNRGVTYRKLGKAEKARRDFEEALRIDPGFEQARRNLRTPAPFGSGGFYLASQRTVCE